MAEVLVVSELVGRKAVLSETDSRTGRTGRMGLGFDEGGAALPDVLRGTLEFLIARKVITKKEFRRLEAEARRKAFTIAGETSKTVLQAVNQRLIDYTSSGGIIEDFIQDIDITFDRLGVSRLNPFHLDTVFLTNMMTGYSAGRERVMDRLPVDEFPLRQVVSVGDNRVRDGHEAIDGYTARADDPVWGWFKTPFSYRCRCRIRPVHVSEGLSESGFVPDVRGKEGFEFLR